MRAAWLAKCISGNIGFNLECYNQIFDFGKVEEFAPEQMYPNDDLDIQLAWLDVLLEKGGEFTGEDLIKKFIKCYHFDFSEYGYAKRNYKRGVLPPYSGRYNNYFSECMGCPIRSEVWALVSSGNVELALKFVETDAKIDHSGESVEAEKFLCAVESLAFFKKDLLHVLELALGHIRKDCLIDEIVRCVICRFRGGAAWLEVIKYLHSMYGSSDGTYAVINVGILVAALLYGGDNFDSVMVHAVNGGYDTDCTCATAGAIYALLYGIDGIGKKWKDLADGQIITATKNLCAKISNFDELA